NVSPGSTRPAGRYHNCPCFRSWTSRYLPPSRTTTTAKNQVGIGSRAIGRSLLELELLGLRLVPVDLEFPGAGLAVGPGDLDLQDEPLEELPGGDPLEGGGVLPGDGRLRLGG